MAQRIGTTKKLEPYITIVPTITIEFGLMSATSRNRCMEMFRTLYNPYAYNTIPGGIAEMIYEKLPIKETAIPANFWSHFLIAHTEEAEQFEAVMLLNGRKLKRITWGREHQMAAMREKDTLVSDKIISRLTQNYLGEKVAKWRLERLDEDERDFRTVIMDQCKDALPFTFRRSIDKW